MSQRQLVNSLLSAIIILSFISLAGAMDPPTQEEVVTFLKAKNKECGGNQVRNSCYKNAAVAAVRAFSFETIISALEEIQSKDPASSYHDFLHFLASEQYQIDRNLAKLFSKCTSVYFNACYHGVVTGFLEQPGMAGADLPDIEKSISQVCNSLKNNKVVGIYSNCIHGIGHALMVVTNNELPDSLKLCDSLGPYLGHRCYEGVFMENFPGTTSSDHPSKYLKEDDPLYPCNSLENKYLTQCYTFLTSHFIFKSGSDLTKATSQCLVMPKEYRFTCYSVIGSSIGGNIMDISIKKEACQGVPEGEPREWCILGIVGSFADRFGGIDDKFLQVFDFCKTVNYEYKKVCYQQAGRNLREWVVDENTRANACDKVGDGQEKLWCLGKN